MGFPTGKIPSVLVFLERRKSRKLVGELSYETEEKNYVFQYDKKYLQLKLIPLGPELPLSRKKFVSKTLFESFVDRIPSKENPAYKDYCAIVGSPKHVVLEGNNRIRAKRAGRIAADAAAG